MARKQEVKPLKFRIFIGDFDHPWESLTAEEQEKFRDQTVERMGQALNNYYACHMDEYERL